MSFSIRCVLLLLAIAAVTAGCDPYVRTTQIDLRNPSLIHYATSDGRLVSSTDGTPTTVANHDVRVQGTHYAELIVTARTAPDGTLVTSWQTDPDLLRGEKKLALGGSNDLIVDDRAPLSTSQQTLSFPVCGRYDYLGGGRRKIFGRAPQEPVGASYYAIEIGANCDVAHDVELTAQTPLSNVRSATYIAKNNPSHNILLAVATTIVTGTAGTFLLAAPTHGEQPLTSIVHGAGVGTLALGAGIDLAILIPAIFAHDHEDVVYGRAP